MNDSIMHTKSKTLNNAMIMKFKEIEEFPSTASRKTQHPLLLTALAKIIRKQSTQGNRNMLEFSQKSMNFVIQNICFHAVVTYTEYTPRF